MIFAPFRLLTWALGLIVIGVPIAAAAFFLLAVMGSPGACDSRGRTIVADLSGAASFQEKWDDMNSTLDAGQPSSATFTESEATSRARLWVEQNDAPVSDLVLCFNTDGGSGSAKVDLPFLPGDVDILVYGTLDLTGEKPVADIDSIEMGMLPGQMTDLVENFVTRLIDDETAEVTLQHDYGITYGEGEITITGQP